MKVCANPGITRKKPCCIHASPAGHINTRLDIDTVGCRVQNKQMEVMGYRRLSGRIGEPPAPPRGEP